VVGPGALDELLPDERLRAAVRAEGHELPADFYGNHLDVATSPERVVELLRSP
jgi:hypothetical protein